MSRITGQQARELLDGIIPGPWVAYHDVDARGDDPVSTIESHHHYDSPLAVVDGDGVSTPENARLIAYAPALAETVAWLYDRIREIHNDQRVWADAYRAPIPDDPWSILPERAARAEAHDDCADMLQTLLDDEEARP